MAKMTTGNFYYGGYLLSLMQRGICPTLIERSEDRQVYEFMTNQQNFRLFLKYRSMPNATQREGYRSWSFALTPQDVQELTRYCQEAQHLSVGLICGNLPLRDSECAVLHKDEIQGLLEAGQTSLTVSRQAGEKAFRLSRTGGRALALTLKANRVF